MSARNGTGVAPPQDLEAEQSVLGGILLSDRAMYGLVIEEGLQPGDFYRERHRLIYDAMRRLHADGEPVDVLTVRDQLERDGTLQTCGGRAAIDELTGGVPGLGGIRRYAQIVIDCARARELLEVSYDIQALVAEKRRAGAQLLADAEQMIFKLGQTTRRTRDTPLSEALDEELARLSELTGTGKTFTGLATGLPALDDMLNGLHPGRLYVLAARPGMGKTSIAQNIAVHAALKENASVLFASLEMGEAELAQRHLSAESGIDANRIQRATLNTGDWPRLLGVAKEAAGARFFILDDADLSLLDLRSHARQVAVREKGLGLVVVDYLQLMRADPPRNNRTEDVSAFSRGLKRLARELECPVIALSQLSRQVEQRTDKRPLLSDLRESGQIEADADVVCMLYRDDYYHDDSEHPGRTELLVRKSRQGRQGVAYAVFNPVTQRFRAPLAPV